MPWTQLVLLILGSAGVGALMSSGLSLLGSWRERTARRKELLLSKAIELAIQWTQVHMQLAEKSKQRVVIQDNVISAAEYYKELRTLLDTGALSPTFITKAAALRRKAMEKYGLRDE